MSRELPGLRRVMVGTDGSVSAEQAVRWAAGFAERFDADLYAVQVIVPEHPADTETGAAERSRAADRVEELTRRVRAVAGERGHGRVVVDDDPAMAMVRAAAEDSIDVLVVGNVGMGGRKEFLLGNVPNRISHNAPCTVIIVNTGSPQERASLHGRGNGRGGGASGARRFARGGRIAAVFARHGLRELFGRPDEEGVVGRRRQARSLRAALEELGPTFAKIGQILSTRPDLLPPEFIEELARLQDHVTPLTEQQVVRVMEEDLGVPWEDVFETIEREPLAAGTIAQVHRASLSSGERVVVKVQRPEARQSVEQDLALLQIFADKAGGLSAVRQRIDVRSVFEHLSTSLQRELDFREEARNAERLRGVIADFPRLAVPAIHKDLSTSRLLVMQDVAGVPATDIPPGPVRKETATQFVESYCKQIVVDGFFHADPHPGNLMWQPTEERLYFLDLGMVGELGAEMRETMILVLGAFWQKDGAFLAETLLSLSRSPARSQQDAERFRTQIEDLVARHRGESARGRELGPILHELTEISLRNGVSLPPPLALSAKALSQMPLLDPEVDPFEVAGRFLLRSLVHRLLPGGDVESLFYRTQKLWARSGRVLEGLERIVGAGPGQGADVGMRSAALDDAVRRAGRRLSLGLSGGFALLASALTATSDRVTAWVPMAFGVVAAALLVGLVADLTLGRAFPRPVSESTRPQV